MAVSVPLFLHVDPVYRQSCDAASCGRGMPSNQGLDPVLVVEVPAHGALQTLAEVHGRGPVQLGSDASIVDGVAQIVARAVSNKGDQAAILAGGVRP